ncbi:hypothetical protein OG948_04215 [Embleya sp. NBC_00888]|uniref:hypothetical protein n=1 Tax=Embleya sp. NBC_00888 TaxID=2975960 RepID=UPI003867FB5E|nr:hypothetical protein OG948_04215 [Embleya sp. NBC_00888]
MPFAETSPHEDYTAAVERVAGRALGVLMDVEGTVVPAGFAATDPWAAEPHDRDADLPGLRVLGSDAFAPHVLRGTPLPADQAEAAARAFDLFPPDTLGASPETAWIITWRDWATARTLTRFGLAVDVPLPGDGAQVADATTWQAWSVRMAQLSSLALPGLDGPIHAAARRNADSLARGVVRAMLRRDYRTAARIARWLAFVAADGVAFPLELDPLLRHVRLFGGGSTRTVLDTRIAQHVTAREDS